LFGRCTRFSSHGIKVECFRDERFVKARTVNPKNFFAELQRRNVYKVAIAYAVVAWLLMQVASQIFPFFEIPNWAVRLVVLLLVIGFPVALILAWAFDLTPQGIKRTEVADEEPTERSRNRAWIYVMIVAGALSIGLFFLGRYTSSKTSESSELPAKSVAVLPFENLSHDPDNAYFADGIQEEILTRLAKIADLKVISRTSTQHYKSAPENLPEIAKQLGVANILEGSVQKAGDSVRVNVKLIQAASDSHLWADTYDRKLTDIFGVESEIAKAIAETLQAKLTGSEGHALSVRPTDNPVAHQLYLKGRFFWNKRTTNDLKKSVDYFNQAIAADPKYALAYVGLADAYVLMPAYGAGAPRDCYPQAKAAAKKALELHDAFGEAYTSLARVLCVYDFDFSQGTREFERAIELNPNYATAHLLGLLAYAYGCSGNKAESMKILDQLTALSKQRFVSVFSFALVYLRLGQKNQALHFLEKSYEDRDSVSIALIKIHPFLDPLRGDPRFEALVAKVFSAQKPATQSP
jgi:TolB-like protein